MYILSLPTKRELEEQQAEITSKLSDIHLSAPNAQPSVCSVPLWLPNPGQRQ